MSYQTSKVSVICKKTVLGKKTEFKYGVALKKTTTTYPTFKVDVEFVEKKGWRGVEKKRFTCPFCKKVVQYKAFRREFSLKKAVKWIGALFGISVLLFMIAFYLFGYGGWSIDQAMWYFGMWSIIGFIVGMGLLIGQILRYLVFYRENKYRYIFSISELGSQHLTPNMYKRSSWNQPPL